MRIRIHMFSTHITYTQRSDFVITISIINQKGGVGKSTTASAIGCGLARKGKKVLFVDLDSQGNLSSTLQADCTGLTGISSYEVLTGITTAENAIQKTSQGHIIASSPALAGADLVLTQVGKEYRLKQALNGLEGMYDYVIIDTPPALGILTVNALTASNKCIIPAQPAPYSLDGIKQLYSTIQTIWKYTNKDLQIAGILLTRYSSRAVINREIAQMLEQSAKEMGSKLFNVKIRECISIKEAQAMKQDIFTYAPRCNASIDYKALVEEVIGDER